MFLNIMEKSIPLKEIVGFLPYELKVFLPADELTIDLKEFILDKEYYTHERDLRFIKPIVRPLSDLTKEITHNGETFVPLKYLHQEVFNCEWPEFEIDFQTLDLIVNCSEEFYISFQDIKRMLEKLHEWHLDIYDWIKDGLAVDLNTL